ncbi:MAG: response regulator [candidate division KSB1 bacterium]|nr:response regulator [candidate division KSB1 bacterium]MDZ7303014.1 response regulator [candidate division KSB1 bacterium]MDZ7312478.1 response regulator [candidate division KSB1 bacterium]
MVALIVILTIVVFIVVDVALRLAMRRLHEAKIKKERKQALDAGLRLDYTDEAKSLKRVQIENPKAKILAVDDETIVLDSFRKILVMAGYSVDTVETGKEAIGLVRKNDYDFVFTDLKMPEMDGLEVTKAVKHLRPDIDVIVITGYATIKSAVEAMKYGAMDYVQKPFTEDELVDFVNKSLIRRQDKLERQIKPKVHLVTPSVGESASKHEFNVPAGIFISPAHAWARIELNGLVRVGIDDFAQKTIGQIEAVELPLRGQQVEKGDPLFSIKQGHRRVVIPSPISGKIASINSELLDRPELIKMKPYELGWVCSLEPANLSADLQTLKIGADAVSWYQQEIDKFSAMLNKAGRATYATEVATARDGEMEKGQMDDEMWETFSKTFFQA